MSRVIVRIPTPLRGFAGGQSEIAAEGADVGAVMAAVGRRPTRNSLSGS